MGISKLKKKGSGFNNYNNFKSKKIHITFHQYISTLLCKGDNATKR